jgi:hypothetical protein
MQAAMDANGCRCTKSVTCFRRRAIFSPPLPAGSAAPVAAEAGVGPGVEASLLWVASAGPAPSAISDIYSPLATDPERADLHGGLSAAEK